MISNKLIEEVIKEAAGEEAIPLYKALKNKFNISEFKLASTIKQDINKTRNLLYKLYHANLVSFTRKKDKKKGWYIYYWTFQPKKVNVFANKIKNKRLEMLTERLKREEIENFFSCVNKCMRLDFEKSTEFGFKCPECGELMNQEDNQEEIKNLRKKINQLEKELKVKI